MPNKGIGFLSTSLYLAYLHPLSFSILYPYAICPASARHGLLCPFPPCFLLWYLGGCNTHHQKENLTPNLCAQVNIDIHTHTGWRHPPCPPSCWGSCVNPLMAVTIGWALYLVPKASSELLVASGWGIQGPFLPPGTGAGSRVWRSAGKPSDPGCCYRDSSGRSESWAGAHSLCAACARPRWRQIGEFSGMQQKTPEASEVSPVPISPWKRQKTWDYWVWRRDV